MLNSTIPYHTVGLASVMRGWRRCTGRASQTMVVFPSTSSQHQKGTWAPHLCYSGVWWLYHYIL